MMFIIIKLASVVVILKRILQKCSMMLMLSFDPDFTSIVVGKFGDKYDRYQCILLTYSQSTNNIVGIPGISVPSGKNAEGLLSGASFWLHGDKKITYSLSERI